MFGGDKRPKCSTMKNMLVTLNVIIDDLFSVGTQRVPLFETVNKMLAGTCEKCFALFRVRVIFLLFYVENE